MTLNSRHHESSWQLNNLANTTLRLRLNALIWCDRQATEVIDYE
ncbi:hypothetical protein [Nostoc linckia]|nr:hypothetical protein [Nostoc linckia]